MTTATHCGLQSRGPTRLDLRQWLAIAPAIESLVVRCITTDVCGWVFGLLALNQAAFAAPHEALSLQVEEAQGRLTIQHKRRPLLVCSFAAHQFKPYVGELYSLTGINVLRDAPADHLHHHGLMYAVRVNGVNFWEERDQPGFEKSIRLLGHCIGEDAQHRPVAAFTHLIHWVASDHRSNTESEQVALLVERRTITVAVDETRGEVAVRWCGEFSAGKNAGTVKLHGSAYNGLGLRLPAEFDASARHLNSERTPYSKAQQGDVTAARWSAVFQPLQSRPVMVAIFSHHENHGETRFFTMLNPFAYLSVTQNLDQQPLEYQPGANFQINYLVCVYSEPKSVAFLNQRQAQWEKE
ncbi:MAG: DUF6807 family protein [Verrucomicrobiota bacterium]